MKLTLAETPMLLPAATEAAVVLIKVAVIFSLKVVVGLPAVAVANSADVVAVENNFVAAVAVAAIRVAVVVDTPVTAVVVAANGPTPIPNFKATSTRHSRFHRRKSCISATCRIPRVSKIWK